MSSGAGDNRCTLHSVTPTDYYTGLGENGRRLMHRISLVSDYKADDASVGAAKL